MVGYYHIKVLSLSSMTKLVAIVDRSLFAATFTFQKDIAASLRADSTPQTAFKLTALVALWPALAVSKKRRQRSASRLKKVDPDSCSPTLVTQLSCWNVSMHFPVPRSHVLTVLSHEPLTPVRQAESMSTDFTPYV